ncbi:uncharacterized protein [Drosophila kikkawai]|uniref:Uncharacterized protein n=1 Tax=Drosophila kikkawai TaxID=30033 RepID=A0A6P4JEA6_DROKI|nr:uncharacterized protein LOC108082127 [Drosophila kikkawai]
MHRHGTIQALLLAFTALICLQMQLYDALPLPSSDPEPLDTAPAVRTARQAALDLETGIQKSVGGFKVFPKKNRVDLRPMGTMVTKESAGLPKGSTDLPKGSTDLPKGSTDLPKGSTSLPKSRPTAGRRIYYKQDEPAPEGGSEEASAESGSAEGGSAEGGSSEGKEGGGEGAVAGGGAAASGQKNKQKETISKYDNELGHPFMDDRFKDMPRIAKIEANPVKNYYPSLKNLTTVCMNRTTIYNEFKIENWLMRGLSSKKKTDREFLLDLRLDIFVKGDSESCHNQKFSDWRMYQECALRRNQRMEFYIPKYPRQQIVMT